MNKEKELLIKISIVSSMLAKSAKTEEERSKYRLVSEIALLFFKRK
jgi:hypothetical protein